MSAPRDGAAVLDERVRALVAEALSRVGLYGTVTITVHDGEVRHVEAAVRVRVK